MKKGFLLIMTFSLLIFLTTIISASCSLNLSMVNQDPYTAVPGEYVKLLFQLSGVENAGCNEIEVELIQDYPISLDPSENSIKIVQGGTFTTDYISHLMVPYKVRVADDALDGDALIKIKYSEKGGATIIKEFSLYIKDVKVDFEVFLRDYNSKTKKLNLEILNIGKNDVNALTIKIPPQENITLYGADTNIIGSLDSEDYTTADFDAILFGNQMIVIIYYSDENNQRRTQTEIVSFDKKVFENKSNENKGFSISTYILILLVIFFVGRWIYYRRKKKRIK